MIRVFQLIDGCIVAIFEYDALPEFVNVDPRFISAPADREDLNIGWRLIDGIWQEPLPAPTITVSVITSFQAKAALDEAGLLDSVKLVISSADTPVRIKLAWDEGLDFRRDNPLISWVASRVPLTEAQIDELFYVGSQISPDIF